MRSSVPKIAAVALLFAVGCGGSDGGETSPGLGVQEGTGVAYVSAVDAQRLGDDAVRLEIQGDLPTPCHEVKTSAQVDPTRPTVINLRVWSTAPSDRVCEQVLTPFTTSIDVHRLPRARYSVIVSGREVASFET